MPTNAEPFALDIRPFHATDEELRAKLSEAHLPSLLPAIAYLTGDRSILSAELLPDTDFMAPLPLSAEQEERAREVAFEALVRYRDGGCQPAPTPTIEQLEQILDFATGSREIGDYLPLLHEELALEGDQRAPGWQLDEIAPGKAFRVLIVGAGMSGLLAAVRLQQAGIPFTLFEKNASLGGTWWENIYPGCRVDVPNHFYSYSFAQKADWPQHFSTQDVLLDYFREFAERFGLTKHIRFSTEVVEANWNEDSSAWQLTVNDGEAEEIVEGQCLISAVGQLNRPKMPDIEGIDDFEGEWFHSAEWDRSVELEGKRAVVIGTGCSACQFIPIVADQVEHLTVFQRTAPWMFPTPEYHDPVPAGLQWLFEHVPHYVQWYRFWVFWTSAEGALSAAYVDPEWNPPEGMEHSVSELNDQLREVLTEYLRDQAGDDDELFRKLLPNYPPAAKRVVRDNGIWATTMKRDDVDLVTVPIERITAEGVLTTDGTLHEADVLIYGTGFQAERFLTPMKVRGTDGVDLHEQWDGNARAFKGISIPNFPNFFCLYGPNTNVVINASIIFFSECEVTYLMGCLRALLEGDHGSLDCKLKVHNEYNDRIDAGNLTTAWGSSKVSSWYKSQSGRVAQNWPFSLLEYWQQTREPDLSDYELS